MPTYQYVCTDCTSPHEAQQSFSEDALTDCPTCDGRLRKVFSAVGVVFKGSGFYRNDSRAPEPSNGSADGSSSKKSDQGDKSETSSSKDTKSDAAASPSQPERSSNGSGSGSGSSSANSGKATAAAGAAGSSTKP